MLAQLSSGPVPVMLAPLSSGPVPVMLAQLSSGPIPVMLAPLSSGPVPAMFLASSGVSADHNPVPPPPPPQKTKQTSTHLVGRQRKYHHTCQPDCITSYSNWQPMKAWNSYLGDGYFAHHAGLSKCPSQTAHRENKLGVDGSEKRCVTVQPSQWPVKTAHRKNRSGSGQNTDGHSGALLTGFGGNVGVDHAQGTIAQRPHTFTRHLAEQEDHHLQPPHHQTSSSSASSSNIIIITFSPLTIKHYHHHIQTPHHQTLSSSSSAPSSSNIIVISPLIIKPIYTLVHLATT